MKNKVEVVFENSKVRFITSYSGHLSLLRDNLKFSGEYTNASLHAVKFNDYIRFSVMGKNTNLNFIEIAYDIRFYENYADSKPSDYVDLEIFERLVKPYGFVVENMYAIKQEKKK